MRTDKTIIGVVHLPPSPGFDGAPDLTVVLRNALEDANAFQEGGVDAIILENNYDIPHMEKVGSSTIDVMMEVASSLRRRTDLPMGICVLWNDYWNAFLVAKKTGLDFVRVPVFVDTVRTEYGVISGNAKDVLDCRSRLGAEHVKIFADVHVKHAELLSDPDLSRCVRAAVMSGADGVVITGAWTGYPPTAEDLRLAKIAADGRLVFVGSGANAENVRTLLLHADGAIASTSLKRGGMPGEHRQNVVGWNRRIDRRKVERFVASLGASPL